MQIFEAVEREVWLLETSISKVRIYRKPISARLCWSMPSSWEPIFSEPASAARIYAEQI